MSCWLLEKEESILTISTPRNNSITLYWEDYPTHFTIMHKGAQITASASPALVSRLGLSASVLSLSLSRSTTSLFLSSLAPGGLFLLFSEGKGVVS